MRCFARILVAALAAAPALAQVVTSEFDSFPVDEGWDSAGQFCDPDTWLDGGWYFQHVELGECAPGPDGAEDRYTRPIDDFLGVNEFFLEFHAEAAGDQSEIPGGAPAVLAAGSDGAVAYNFTISRDLVRVVRDVVLPIVVVEIDPGVEHTYRLELFGARLYAWYIDGELIDSGIPEGPYPSFNPRIAWRGKSWFLESTIRWDYIRYGAIPDDGSFDFDSDGDVDYSDYYFVTDCLTKDGPGIFGGPDNDAGPGCRFADADHDADVDLRDIAAFQNAFTGGE